MAADAAGPKPPLFVLLRCSICGQAQRKLWVDLLAEIRESGIFRRNASPSLAETQAIMPVYRGASAFCGQCEGSRVELISGEIDDWEDGIRCESCRQEIDAERLEALPDVKTCRACSGNGGGEGVTYCPRCGTPVQWETRTRGNRYRQSCAGCGWRD